MNRMLPLLAQLDGFYRADNLDTYQQRWQIERLFPGFPLASAEIFSAGWERVPHGGMRHVPLLTERNAL